MTEEDYLGSRDELLGLIHEMSVTWTNITGIPLKSNHEQLSDEQLRNSILKLADLINDVTDDIDISGLMGSIFDTLTVDEIYCFLKEINENYRPIDLSGGLFSDN